MTGCNNKAFNSSLELWTLVVDRYKGHMGANSYIRLVRHVC